MGGGLLQLSVTGIEDNYLNNNPNINFFKKVYMRYTNFTMSTIEVLCSNFSLYNGNLPASNKKLPFNETSHFRVKIPRNGDLIDNVFLRVQLPDIISEDLDLKYVDNLGSSLIKSASLYIEDTLIESITGEFIYAYHKLNEYKGKNNIFDVMSNGEYKNFNKYNKQEVTSGKTNKFYNTMPGITSRNIAIPLYFWFSKIRGLALPLIALRYHQVFIDFELRPMQDLIVKSNNENKSDTGLTNNRNYFTKPEITFNMESYYKNTHWELNPKLDINYIFLDNKERTEICKHSQKYLVEQVNLFNVKSIDGIGKNLEFTPYHPVKEIIILPKRDDIGIRNEWTNFTNFDYPNIDYKKYQKTTINNEEKIELSKIWKHRKYEKIPTIDKNNYTFFNENIIEKLNIEIDGKQRLEYKPSEYFTLNQHLEHYKGCKIDGVLTYSFSKDPGRFQPTGFCNTSEIDNLVFNIDLKTPSNFNEDYKYDLAFYFINYNILEIQNGMGGIKYSNK